MPLPNPPAPVPDQATAALSQRDKALPPKPYPAPRFRHYCTVGSVVNPPSAAGPFEFEHAPRGDGVESEALSQVVRVIEPAVLDPRAGLEDAEILLDRPAGFVPPADAHRPFGGSVAFGRQQQPAQRLPAFARRVSRLGDEAPQSAAAWPAACRRVPPVSAPATKGPASPQAAAEPCAPTKRTDHPPRCAIPPARTTLRQAPNGWRLPPRPLARATPACPRKTVVDQSAYLGNWHQNIIVSSMRVVTDYG